MKTVLLAMLLFVATTLSPTAHAGSFYQHGVWYGNICRTGLYFSVVAYQPIGFGCWNYAWGMNGVISHE